MATDPVRVKALFQKAIEKDDRADRRAFLDAEIGGDAELRHRLDALLAAFDDPPAALERPLGDDDPGATVDTGPQATVDIAPSPARTDPEGPTLSYHDPDAAGLLNSVIADRYKIRQSIGEGGMGTVFLAEQLRPVKRQVALKLIKPGMDSRQVLARFESERQALALMDHPNIARVLDAGSTADGRPFFVMELVKGVPLTQYCDDHRLDLPARLSLFRQICSAVQHAHQKGIIHRDLKPTNILVESHDDKPVPKVIDFGLAKATSGMQLSEHSLFTAFGSVAGTPLYMAPEQATFNALDVDTRADIYALGVILYELLTGSTPITRETMRRAALEEMLRSIREVEPPVPSSRISSSAGRPSVAANRHIEPARLSRLVRGDLDWIVMKALAKERDRRYDSAVGLANDVERFLNHEPVSAGPPTAAYRLRKFVRRNRGRVVAASLVIVAMVAGVIGTTWGLIEARRERQRAERRLAQVATMNDILGSVFEDLDPDLAETEGKPLAAILGDRLDRAASEVDAEATGDPLAAARMLAKLGRSQRGLAHYEEATRVLARARDALAALLGADDPEALRCADELAMATGLAGRIDRAIALYEGLPPRMDARLGPDDPVTLESRATLGALYERGSRPEEAVRLLEEAIPRMRAALGPAHRVTLRATSRLAQAYASVGRPDRSIALYEQALASERAALRPGHPDTLQTMLRLGSTYVDLGRLDRGLALAEEAHALAAAGLGPDHATTLRARRILALALLADGQRRRAIDILGETSARERAKLGADHPDTIDTLVVLATALTEDGRFEEARPLWDAAVAARRKVHGEDHRATMETRLGRADNELAAGRLKTAEADYRAVLADCLRVFGPGHDPTTDFARVNLGTFLAERGDPAEAEALFRSFLSRRQTAPGDSLRQFTLMMLGRALLALKQDAEAEGVLREALRVAEADRLENWVIAEVRSLLGWAYFGQGKHAPAEPLLRSGYEGLSRKPEAIIAFFRPFRREALDRLIAFGEATGKAEEVRAWTAERAKLADGSPKSEAGEK